MVAASHRFAHAMIALEAGIPETGPAPARPAFREFAEGVEKTLEGLSAKLRGHRVTEREFPDLRNAYLKLVQTGGAESSRYAIVNVEADRMVNSLNTLREQILEWQREMAAVNQPRVIESTDG